MELPSIVPNCKSLDPKMWVTSKVVTPHLNKNYVGASWAPACNFRATGKKPLAGCSFCCFFQDIF